MPIDNMLTINDNMYDTFYDFITAFLPDENIFLLDSDFIAPEGPYTALKIVKLDPISQFSHNSFTVDGEGRAMVSTMYLGHVMIRCFGRNGFARALTISHHLRDNSVRQILRDGGFGYSASSSVSDDSVAIDNQKTEERGTLTVTGHVVISSVEGSVDPVGTIEEIETPSTITDNC